MPCIVEDHQAICKFCPPGFEIDANYGCIQGSTVGCRDNSQCPSRQACQNKKCVNPCSLGECSGTQNCEVANHRAQCVDVPRCECTDDSQCGAQGPGYFCDNCECKIKPGFEPDVACDPDDFECSTRNIKDLNIGCTAEELSFMRY